MMAGVQKDQEREELHRAIWAIADDLRGSVDGWDFKSYVLGMMFYRYMSENLAHYINKGEWEAGFADFDYAALSDEEAEQARADMVSTRGFFIPPSELFCNVQKRAADDIENLNMTLEAVFRHIEESARGSESEDDFAGLFDDIDVNSNKLGATVAKRNANLVKLMDGVASMALGAYQAIVDAGRTVGEDIYLVGVDALDEVQEMVKEGKVTGTVLNDHIGQSHTAADAAIKAANGETLEKYYWVDYVKVTK